MSFLDFRPYFDPKKGFGLAQFWKFLSHFKLFVSRNFCTYKIFMLNAEWWVLAKKWRKILVVVFSAIFDPKKAPAWLNFEIFIPLLLFYSCIFCLFKILKFNVKQYSFSEKLGKIVVFVLPAIFYPKNAPTWLNFEILIHSYFFIPVNSTPLKYWSLRWNATVSAKRLGENCWFWTFHHILILKKARLDSISKFFIHFKLFLFQYFNTRLHFYSLIFCPYAKQTLCSVLCKKSDFC